MPHDDVLVNEVQSLIYRGEFVSILGASGTGKTMFLERLRKRFEPLHDYYCSLYVDFRDEKYHVFDRDKFFQILVADLGHGSGLRFKVEDVNERHHLLNRAVDTFLATDGRNLLLIFDHVEELKPYLGHSLLKTLRYVVNNRPQKKDYSRITSVVAGAVSLYELSKGRTSPFNVSKIIRIFPFDRYQVRALVSELEMTLPDEQVDRLFEYLGGDRALTMGALEAVKSDVVQSLDAALEHLRRKEIETGNSRFRRMMSRLDNDSVLLHAVMEVVAQGICRSPELITDIGALELTGFLRVEQDGWVFSAPFWRDLVTEQLSPQRLGELLLVSGEWISAVDVLGAEPGIAPVAPRYKPGLIPGGGRRLGDLVQSFLAHLLEDIYSLTEDDVLEALLDFAHLVLGLHHIVVHDVLSFQSILVNRSTFPEWKEWEAQAGPEFCMTEQDVAQYGRAKAYWSVAWTKSCFPMRRSKVERGQRSVGWIMSVYAPPDTDLSRWGELLHLVAGCGLVMDLVGSIRNSPVDVTCRTLDQIVAENEAVVIINDKHKVVWASAYFCERHGNVLGQDCFSVTRGRNERCDQCLSQSAIEKKSTIRGEQQKLIDQYGTPYWATVVVRPDEIRPWGKVTVHHYSDVTLHVVTQEIIGKVVSARSLDDAIAILPAELARSFLIDRVRLYRLVDHPDRYVLAAAEGMPPDVVGYEIPVDSEAGRMIDTNFPATIYDPRATLSARIQTDLGLGDATEVMDIGLESSGERFGVLSLDNGNSHRPLWRWDRNMLVDLGHRIAQTLILLRDRERLELALLANKDASDAIDLNSLQLAHLVSNLVAQFECIEDHVSEDGRSAYYRVLHLSNLAGSSIGCRRPKTTELLDLIRFVEELSGPAVTVRVHYSDLPADILNRPVAWPLPMVLGELIRNVAKHADRTPDRIVDVLFTFNADSQRVRIELKNKGAIPPKSLLRLQNSELVLPAETLGHGAFLSQLQVRRQIGGTISWRNEGEYVIVELDIPLQRVNNG